MIDRNERNGYAEFIFKSDYDKDCPRFEAICAGNIPDVVPGVPVKVEFSAACIADIKKVDFQKMKIERITKDIREQFKNKLLYTCINYNDEDYARTILMNVKGISTKTANRILDAVDGDIHRLSDLWNDSEFWKGIRGSKRYIEELKDTVGSVLEKDILVQKYSRYGIGYPQVEMLVTMYQLEAESELCNNPYKVLSRLELDFQVADNLAKDIGFCYLDEKRIRAVVYQVLNDNESNGNTALSIDDFYIRCARLHKVSAWKENVISPYYILAIVSKMKSVYYSEKLVGYISTLEKETDIAFQLCRLMQENTSLKMKESYFESIQEKYNKEQLDFLKAFDKNSVNILLGRGGTGKTHTICGAIEMFLKTHPDAKVQLCAPTARAAGVLKEHSGHESSTIHIAIGLSLGCNDTAEKNTENPMEARLIVVDEMSMVDTNLMYHLLRAVQSGAKLILSGDVDQLESVGCGAVLRDFVQSNVIPKTILKKIMRQNEGSAVIENCSRILDGKHNLISNDNFVIRYCNTDEEAKAYLKSCYTGDILHSQIISTTKNGIIGTVSINKEFEDTDKTGIWMHGDYFKEGDKVIFTRNNYDDGYCNGDIGFIESVHLPVRVKKHDDGKIIEINKENSTDMEHADTITIHKSQGSEYDNVFILLPDKPVSLLTRNMVNTAISRAKKNVVLIVVKDALRIAASNVMKKERVTRLEEKLKNMENVLS